MQPELLPVEVVALDMACRCCWATVTQLPRPMAGLWASAHRDAVVVQAHVVTAGGPALWRRR